jgi:hypothetical protein
MTDQDPERTAAESAIERVLRSDLPQDKKLQIIKLLIAEQEKAAGRLHNLAEELIAEQAAALIAEAEQALREASE